MAIENKKGVVLKYFNIQPTIISKDYTKIISHNHPFDYDIELDSISYSIVVILISIVTQNMKVYSYAIQITFSVMVVFFVEDALPFFVIAIIKVHILKHFLLASQFERNITGSPVQKLQQQNGLSYSNVSLMKNESSQTLLKQQKVKNMNQVKRQIKFHLY